MTKRALLLVIVATLLLCLGRAYTFQNEPEGFRGLKWGDPPVPKMEFLKKVDRWMSIYSLAGEKLELGDAQFYMVLYQFYTPSNATVRRLMGVGLYFKEKENFEILRTICTVKFGEPTREGFDELGWVSLAASVILKYDSIDEEGFLGLSSTPIFQQYTREKEKKQAEEAEKDW